MVYWQTFNVPKPGTPSNPSNSNTKAMMTPSHPRWSLATVATHWTEPRTAPSDPLEITEKYEESSRKALQDEGLPNAMTISRTEVFEALLAKGMDEVGCVQRCVRITEAMPGTHKISFTGTCFTPADLHLVHNRRHSMRCY